MSFIGNVPAEAYSPVAKDTFSGNGSTTDFTLSLSATTNGVEVFVENVQQEPTTAYTISGTTLSFTAAPTSGTNNIYVIHRGPAVQTVVPPAGVAIDASTVTATGDISTEGDLKVEVTSGGIYTITGTDTASNRTLTLPDEAGTVLTSASDIESQVKTATNATGTAPIYACRAWVNFNGTGTVAIREDGNVSSITDNGEGDYTVNFSTAMPDANYAVVTTTEVNPDARRGSADMNIHSSASPSASSVRLEGRIGARADADGTSYDFTFVCVSIFR